MKIVRADEMGFCYGVARAADMVEELMNNNKKVYILGMLIHNPIYLKKLHEDGAITVEEEDFISEKIQIPEGSTVVLRAHGARKELFDKLESMNVEVVDTTCPYVTKSILIKLREEEKREVIYIGDKTHPEVKAVLSYGKKVPVIENLEEFRERNFERNKEYSFIVQKTYDNNSFDKIKQFAKENFQEAIFKDDLCGATYERQEAIGRLSKEVDVLIVVGGKMSSNTQKLYKIGKKLNERTYLIEEKGEIRKEWFRGARSVGISSGASTPDYLVEELEKYLMDCII